MSSEKIKTKEKRALKEVEGTFFRKNKSEKTWLGSPLLKEEEGDFLHLSEDRAHNPISEAKLL